MNYLYLMSLVALSLASTTAATPSLKKTSAQKQPARVRRTTSTSSMGKLLQQIEEDAEPTATTPQTAVLRPTRNFRSLTNAQPAIATRGLAAALPGEQEQPKNLQDRMWHEASLLKSQLRPDNAEKVITYAGACIGLAYAASQGGEKIIDIYHYFRPPTRFIGIESIVLSLAGQLVGPLSAAAGVGTLWYMLKRSAGAEARAQKEAFESRVLAEVKVEKAERKADEKIRKHEIKQLIEQAKGLAAITEILRKDIKEMRAEYRATLSTCQQIHAELTAREPGARGAKK